MEFLGLRVRIFLVLFDTAEYFSTVIEVIYTLNVLKVPVALYTLQHLKILSEPSVSILLYLWGVGETIFLSTFLGSVS